MKLNFNFALYSLICLSLVVYSYSQVDLNLTLSSNPVYLAFQQSMTQLGYFNRPLSALIYSVIVVGMFLSYIWLVYQSKNSHINSSNVVKWMLTISFILIIAYPAFSYDIFNYLFDARILVTYQLNPYTHTALDFPEDTWTRFMRWTHRTYPYGPSWLGLTIPVYALGLGKFILTLASFKLLFFVSYWLACYSIYQILKKINPQYALTGLILFGLNPLVLIEGLVSPHLDMTMTGLMLFGLYLITVKSKNVFGWFSLITSIGIKYVSGALAPGLVLWQTKKISFQTMVYLSIGLSYLLTLVVISQREILPWYVLVPFGLTSLLPSHKFLKYLMLSLTPALLFRYLPFIYVGEYTAQVNLNRHYLTLGIFILVFVFLNLSEKYFQKKN